MPVDEVRDDFISHALNLAHFSKQTQKELVVHFTDLSDELEQQILQSGIDKPTFKQRKLRALKKQADATIKSLYDKAAADHDVLFADLAHTESEHTKKITNSPLNVEALSTTISPEQARQISKNTLIQGATQGEWWKGQSQRTQQAFLREARMGMLAGESVDDIARRIAGRFTGKYDVATLRNGKKRRIGRRSGGAMEVSMRNAKTLVRTAINNVSNAAREATLKKNTDVIKGMEALVTFDNRTSAICISRSGGAWDIESGEPLPQSAVGDPYPGPPPWHWNCRTILIPVLKGWDELGSSTLAKLKEASPETRASMDGEVSADLTFSQWLKQKEKAEPGFADSLLGKGRAKLWRDNKITLQQLVDGSGKEYTLKQLKQGVPKAARLPKGLPITTILTWILLS